MKRLEQHRIKALKALAQWRGREACCAAMLLLSASCVPLNAAQAPQQRQAAAATLAAASLPAAIAAGTIAPPVPEPMELEAVSPTDAFAINAAIKLAAGANPRAPSMVFRASAPADQFRALQCLSEAIYYEARSEAEDGQRAVAQVVLNRVRSPAYPGTVCGVVYQGPMRAGGGCQFTFTCDGSLARSPSGAGWLRARRIASEALAGAVYAPVGHATHYHTHQVVPSWAHKLLKNAVIGSHNFYRMEGVWGTPQAFTRRYAGREPSPATIMATRLPSRVPQVGMAMTLPIPGAVFSYQPPLDYSAVTGTPAPEAAPPPPPVNEKLPQSRVKPEFENSGRWIAQPGSATP